MANPPPRPSQQPAQPRQQTGLTVKGFTDQLGKYGAFIQKLIPAMASQFLTPERMMNLAVSAFMRNEELRLCNMLSIVNSVALAAQLGLEVNTPLGHAYLIPYKRVCTMQPGYRGLVHLALQSPRAHSVDAHVVYAGDEFDYQYGSQRFLHHKPKGPRVDWTAAYCVLDYRGGTDTPTFLVMSRAEIEDLRKQSSQTDKVWSKWPDEMRRKTPTKRMLKYCELSFAVARAVGLDDEGEAGKVQEPVIEIPQSEWEELMEDERNSADDGQRRDGQAGSSGPGNGGGAGNAPPGDAPPPAAGNAPPQAGAKPANGSAPLPTGAPPPPPQGKRVLTANDFTSPQIGRLMQCLRVAGVTNRARLETWLSKFDGSAEEAIVEAEAVLGDWEREQAKPQATRPAGDPDQPSLGLDAEPLR
jgi:recombination protein RecT